ncbi:SRPBCC family protein [Nocardioides lacusdianchii]|uniref:SRPBCC family protein n=1 Tax=Nocardioides lacusdianchii TaxID=2783664 RepID=UPI001CCE3ADC|nr:SRPBCC family protein [Nocardioides lacusdianchii]
MKTRRRWIRVLDKPVRVEESITFEVPRSAEEVWDFMWDPQSLFVIEPDVTYAGTLPGTPDRQVGEVQVSMHRTGPERQLTALEVVAMEPGRTATTRTLTAALPSGGRLDVEPTGEHSCRLTQRFHTDVPVGVEVGYVEIQRAGLRESALELRERVLRHFGN